MSGNGFSMSGDVFGKGMKKPSETSFQRVCLDFVLLLLWTLSGKRDSDLRLPYALLIKCFPLIRRVVFPKWDTGGGDLRNPFHLRILRSRTVFLGLLNANIVKYLDRFNGYQTGLNLINPYPDVLHPTYPDCATGYIWDCPICGLMSLL